jgi:hypothetical protein
MNDAWELHKTAMDLLAKADKQPNTSNKKYLYLQAYELEKDAASMLQKAPSRLNQRRSVVFFTAIGIALSLNRIEEATWLIQAAEEQQIHSSVAQDWEKCKTVVQNTQEQLNV